MIGHKLDTGFQVRLEGYLVNLKDNYTISHTMIKSAEKLFDQRKLGVLLDAYLCVFELLRQ